MKNKASKYFRLIGIIIFIGILFKIDIKGASRILKDINLEFYSLALIFAISVFFISSMRWFYFLRSQNINYPFFSAVLVNQTSQFIAFISPGRIGELIKIWYLKKDINVSYAKSFMSVFIPRLIDAITLIICSILGLTILSLYERILIIFSILAFCGTLLTIVKMTTIKDIQGDENFWVKNLLYFVREIRSIIGYKLIYVFFITLILYLFFFNFCYFISESIELGLNFTNILFVVSVGNVLSFLPFSIAGIGTRDAAYIIILSQIGKSQENAIIFSSLVFISFYFLGGLLGFISYLIKPIEIRKFDINWSFFE